MRVPYLAVLRITDEGHDLDVEWPIAAGPHRQSLPDYLRAEVELSGERLVDDCHLWRVWSVGERELTAGQHRDPERPEVSRLVRVTETVVLSSGPALKPSTVTLLFQLSLARTDIVDEVTATTPGIARNSSSTCSNSASARSGE